MAKLTGKDTRKEEDNNTIINNNRSSKMKMNRSIPNRKMAKATSPGVVAVVQGELTALACTATFEPVLEPNTTTTTTTTTITTSDRNKKKKKKKSKAKKSKAIDQGVTKEYNDINNDDGDGEDETSTTHHPSDDVDIETGGSAAGVTTIEARLVDEHDECSSRDQQEHEARIRRLEEDIRNTNARAPVIVNAVPVNNKPWWQFYKMNSGNSNNNRWFYNRKKANIAISIIVLALVAIVGIILGVTFGTKESSNPAPRNPSLSPECQKKCEGLLTGIPVTANDREFQNAILEYLKNSSSSPYSSVINCWDVSQVRI
jgi:hypothetical protein